MVWIAHSGPVGKSPEQELGRGGLHSCWESFLETVLWGGSSHRLSDRGLSPCWSGPTVPLHPSLEVLRRDLWSEPSLTLFSPMANRPGASQDRGQPRRSLLL